MTNAQDRFKTEFGGVLFERPEGMSERNYEIVRAHLIDGLSFETISWDYELSRERVRQIVENALRRATDLREHPGVTRRFRPGIKGRGPRKKKTP